MNLDSKVIEDLVRKIIEEKLNEASASEKKDFVLNKDISGITSVKLNTVRVDESNRLDTGNPNDVVYTKDLFDLEESQDLVVELWK